jgi:hypothetical protein
MNLQDSNVAFLNRVLRAIILGLHGQAFLALVLLLAALLIAVAGASSGARQPGDHAGSA